MKKVRALQDYLLKAVPRLADKPEDLVVFLEDGFVRPINGYASHEKVATAVVAIIDVPIGELLAIDMALLLWCKRHQPDLLRAPNAEKAFPFNIEMLDRDTCDVAYKIQLSQLVSIIEREDGKVDVIERDEPDPDPGWAHLDGLKTTARLQQLYVGDDLVAELPAP